MIFDHSFLTLHRENSKIFYIMYSKWKISLIFLLLIFLISGCKTDPRKEYEKVVIEWTGKTMTFPDSMQMMSGERVSPPETDFTIVAYYDSVGCTTCKMKLPYWEEFMAKVNTIVGYGKVTLMIVTNQSAKETRYLVRKNGFKYPVYIDNEDIFIHLNSFPKNENLQSFLLDEDKKVIAIGNPVNSVNIAKLFLNKMKSSEDNFSFDSVDDRVLEYDFGKIKPNQKVKQSFSLWNDTRDTLKVNKIITSCECTQGSISKEVIPPGDTYSITAIFKDTLSGEFLRSISVIFENKQPDIRIELTGEIINNNNHLNF